MSVEKDELEAKNYTALDIINLRKSRTAFMQDSITDETKQFIEEYVENNNKTVNVFNWKVCFDQYIPLKKRERFKNVDNAIFLIGKKDYDGYEQTGFYGQMLLLQLVKRGIHGSFITDEILEMDEYSKIFKLGRNEMLYGIIVLGYEPKKLFFFYEKEADVKKRKDVSEIIKLNRLAPEWFMFGAYAVSLAPSYKNKQPIRLSFIDFIFSIYIKGKPTPLRLMDLGCAKANFTFLTDIVVTFGNYGTLAGITEDEKLPNIFVRLFSSRYKKGLINGKTRREIEADKYKKRNEMDEEFFDSHSYISGDYERLNVNVESEEKKKLEASKKIIVETPEEKETRIKADKAKAVLASKEGIDRITKDRLKVAKLEEEQALIDKEYKKKKRNKKNLKTIDLDDEDEFEDIEDEFEQTEEITENESEESVDIEEELKKELDEMYKDTEGLSEDEEDPSLNSEKTDEDKE